MDRRDPPAAGRGPEVVVIGKVLGPYGVRGWVRLASFTDPPDNILEYSPWQIRGPGRDGQWRPAEVLELRPHQQGFVARLAGCGDRDAAQLLSGSEIGIDAGSLSEPGVDEFYWRDLLGMAVRNREGTTLGRVRQLLETGAHDVLVVARESAEQPIECLIPFHRNYVLEVDPEARLIRVDWQES